MANAENKASPRGDKLKRASGTIHVKTDPRTHSEFAAACCLLNEPMQQRINNFMKSTIEEAFSALSVTRSSQSA